MLRQESGCTIGRGKIQKMIVFVKKSAVNYLFFGQKSVSLQQKVVKKSVGNRQKVVRKSVENR